jgi:hypothetical protein
MLRLIVSSPYRTRSKVLHPSSYYVPARTATQRAGERPKDDHVVNKIDANDVQAEGAQSAMKEKKEGKEGSQGISQKDEGKFNKKAKENHPEAPTPVIGCVPHLSK